MHKRVTLPNFVEIGETIEEIAQFEVLFQNGCPVILHYNSHFNGWFAQQTHSAANLLLKCCECSIFQDGCHPPSWIYWRQVWDHPQRAIGGLLYVQNLVAIGCIVLNTCNFQCYASLAWKSLSTTPLTGLFWGRGKMGQNGTFNNCIPLGMQHPENRISWTKPRKNRFCGLASGCEQLSKSEKEKKGKLQSTPQ